MGGSRLIGELLARGSLTPYQASCVREGRAAELLIGNYLLLSEIGAGGMGVVFKALHQRMDRVVIGTVRSLLERADRGIIGGMCPIDGLACRRKTR
ncbi:MAG: hypothetical protein CMJ64_22235 [Planctomycetaceae bacterium]|nr:hypothetical protein [Planctomycetaceae bacterium]